MIHLSVPQPGQLEYYVLVPTSLVLDTPYSTFFSSIHNSLWVGRPHKPTLLCPQGKIPQILKIRSLIPHSTVKPSLPNSLVAKLDLIWGYLQPLLHWVCCTNMNILDETSQRDLDHGAQGFSRVTILPGEYSLERGTGGGGGSVTCPGSQGWKRVTAWRKSPADLVSGQRSQPAHTQPLNPTPAELRSISYWKTTSFIKLIVETQFKSIMYTMKGQNAKQSLQNKIIPNYFYFWLQR